MPLTHEYCIEQAEICEEHAAHACDERLRREWLETADAWRETAAGTSLGDKWFGHIDLAS